MFGPYLRPTWGFEESTPLLTRRNPPGRGQCSSAPRGPRGPGRPSGAAISGAAGEAGLAARCGWILKIFLGKVWFIAMDKDI